MYADDLLLFKPISKRSFNFSMWCQPYFPVDPSNRLQRLLDYIFRPFSLHCSPGLHSPYNYTRLILDRIVWDPQHKKDQLLLEKVQLFAARLAIKTWSQDQTSLFTSLNLWSLMNHSSYICQTYFAFKVLCNHVFCPSIFFFLITLNLI